MKTPPAITTPEHGQNVTERYGGWILSACFHVVLFSTLLMTRPATHSHSSRAIEPIRVTLTDEALPALTLADAGAAIAAGADGASETTTPPAGTVPDALPTAAVTVLQAPQVARLTAPLPPAKPSERQVASNALVSALKPVNVEVLKAAQESDAGRNAKRPAGSPDAGEGSRPGGDPKAGGSTEPGPASPEGTYAQGTRSKRGDGIGGEGTGAGRGGSPEVGGRISVARADLLAHKTFDTPENLFGSRGASAAAVRELDIGGVPGEKTKDVLDRYGIKVMAANSLIGGAMPYQSKEPGQGQFVTRFSSGSIGIFRFTSVAAGRMMELETQYLRDHGLDPAKTRIVVVVFGVVLSRDGYDLGVVSMRTEPLVVPQTHTVEKFGNQGNKP